MFGFSTASLEVWDLLAAAGDREDVGEQPCTLELVLPWVCGDHVEFPPVENSHPVALPSVWLKPCGCGEREICRAGGKREEKGQS